MLASLSLDAVSLAMAAEVLIACLVWLLRSRLPMEIGRSTATRLIAAWIVVTCLEFWILGPRSFVMVNDEGEFSLPIYIYLSNWYQNGGFAHAITGGVDARVLYGTQYLGLERELFGFLPSWVGVAIHKHLVVLVGASGAYVLARRVARADRIAALALACLFTLGYRYSLTVSVTHGVGFALFAWSAYLLAGRVERRYYWIGVAALGVLHAVSSTPTHSMMGFVAAPVALWVSMGLRRPIRFLGGILVVVTITLVNWYPVIQAMAAHGADSYRALAGYRPDLTDLLLSAVRRQPEMALLSALSLIVLFIAKDRRAIPALCAFAVVIVGPVLPMTFPWETIGLRQLDAIDFTYAGLALTTIALPIASWASTTAGRWSRTRPIAVCAFAFAFGLLAWHKVWHGIQWIGMGGQSVYVAYNNLQDRPWAPAHPFRVVSIPYRLEANTVASYGLETFDGLLNIVPRARGDFWTYAMANPNPGIRAGYTYITYQGHMDFLCCRSYAFANIASADALRMGNVEFVLSLLPLTGDDLEQVSGPDDNWVPPRRDDSLRTKIVGFWHMLVDSYPVYVYRLKDTMGRAHAARSIVVAASEPNPDWYRMMMRLALSGAAVIAPEHAQGLKDPAPLSVLETAITPTGYRIKVEAPDGGLLLVNQQYSPYWRALVDGRNVRPVPANAVEMAVALPPGARNVEMQFCGVAGGNC